MNIAVHSPPLGRRHENTGYRLRIFLKKIIKIRIAVHFQPVPVIHTRAFQIALAETEAQRLNQMKHSTAGNAGASDVPCIGRHFRLMKYNIYFCHSFPVFVILFPL